MKTYKITILLLSVFLLSNCTTVQSSDNKENSEDPTQEDLTITLYHKRVK